MACHLAARATAAPEVTLWARDAAQASAMATARRNERYLPAVALPPALRITADLAAASACDVLFAAVPVAALPALLAALRTTERRAPLLSLAKGFVAADAGGGPLIHQRLAAQWSAPVGVISGPSFAEEVAQGLPTALTVAATVPDLASRVASLLRGDTLRAYVTPDLVGVAVGGAIKNVLAIAAGASDGLRFGHNARAALITRGLAETGRLSTALGGQRETLMGLAGLGDLVLTCTGNLSRNRRVGLALAEGRSLDHILAELGHVAEGVPAAREVARRAAELGIDMPITGAVTAVLDGRITPVAAVEQLMARDPKHE